MDDNRHLREGRLLLNKKLEQLGKPPLDLHLSALRIYGDKRLSMSDRENVLKDLGKGFLVPGTVIRKIFSMEELLNRKTVKSEDDTVIFPPVLQVAKSSELFIGDQKNLPYHFVQCCRAENAEELAGYVTRGRGVSIHKKDCVILGKSDSDRVISVLRKKAPTPRYQVRLFMEAHDRMGLIRDLSAAIAEKNVNIIKVSHIPPNEKKKLAVLDFLLDIEHLDQLELLLSKLEKIPSVVRACKAN
ncbi:bifunctional (p)ppGpp synthetase/guanosine-3',5'-bis(diphosphate) 3'-pyrophosphohydrolase [Candidatus Peregrinibacteria bacterium]|nr:bifunctional (p)ppGpp synthetase/guanosine-3',5'-bis(diphosphate) 3'-pyrophosphohydrolase [Candidatus Peregrinibacteria bacterium]